MSGAAAMLHADPPASAASAGSGLLHARLMNLPAVRTVLDGLVPLELCRELVFVLKASSTVGYRPHVRSATIHDVVSTAPWLLPPLARARAAVLAAVESAFGLSLELCVEFSGLFGWTAGASLGWHHDANREYLSQRHLSAVLYLNDQGADFGAGDFRFQDGPEPLRVQPRAGRLVAYTADARNVHCVEEVAWGERATLTIWFSLEPAAAEDRQVLEQLQRYTALLQPPPAPPQPACPAPPSAGKQPEPERQQPCAALAAPCGDTPRHRQAACGPSVLRPSPAPDSCGPLRPHLQTQEQEQLQEHEQQGAGDPSGESPPSSSPQEPGGHGDGVAPPPDTVLVPHRLWMGRGLPDTMYALPAASEGGAAQDLRVERLRQRGLHVSACPAGATDGTESATHARMPADAIGGGCAVTQDEEDVEPAAASSAVTGLPNATAGGAGDGSSNTAAQPSVTTTVAVWVASDAKQSDCAESARAEASQLGKRARDGSAASGAQPQQQQQRGQQNGAQQQDLHFTGLSEALCAVEYAVYMRDATRIESTEQLVASLGPLGAYVAERTQELRERLPGWLTLGSLLS